MNPIHIIGLGVSEQPELSSAALSALNRAGWVIGSSRQLKIVESLLQDQQTLILPPLVELPRHLDELEQVEALAQAEKMAQDKTARPIVVLASGDPLYYGIGKWFKRHFPSERLRFYPAVSSIQAACHALGLALQDVEVLSLHGRPLQGIRTALKANKTLVVLTDKHSQPSILAQECIAAGFDESHLSVCESLGYSEQRIRHFTARELAVMDEAFDPLHVTVINCQGRGGFLPEFPGIQDDRFITGEEPGKGMITKREVRLNILSLLQPGNDDVIWDIGAGCGSVAIELAYWNERCRVFAIEHHPERLQHLEANRQRFGVVSNLKIQAGHAPEVLTDLPSPSKVFIGGSDGRLSELLALCWDQLPVGGILAASAVTENTRYQLIEFMEQRNLIHDAHMETLQIAVSRGGSLAGQLLYRPALPVTLFRFVKSADTKNRLGNDPE
ncbi:precorrin-6y C5,15-methyltransferase (decarboxylating) subunit CbiE [Hahella sp. CCB-MM4]|uniref:precorrin-6y C5,15-methyltransferase (decarboxylating) subunit CbiE n=1 Tax=Hahella sp. (strain CCB-MM4) TaxID=1926491 RepID=UPI000B9A540A|nr:precorrin-6y C5,15-methyltransferase (decarboxylating) subunit CbiE [Hahella sp. CCB-MM4]